MSDTSDQLGWHAKYQAAVTELHKTRPTIDALQRQVDQLTLQRDKLTQLVAQIAPGLKEILKCLA